jgi:hypothetical protein
LTKLGADRGIRSADRNSLAEHLSTSVSQTQLGDIVRNQIRERPTWRADSTRTPSVARLQRAHMSSDFLARRVREPRLQSMHPHR